MKNFSLENFFLKRKFTTQFDIKLYYANDELMFTAFIAQAICTHAQHHIVTLAVRL